MYVCHTCAAYQAAFDYDGDKDEDLGFKTGDIVLVRSKEANGWWSGECRGKYGWFPAAYVEPVDTSGAGAAPIAKTISEEPPNFDEPAVPEVPAEAPSTKVGAVHVALYSYESDQPTDLVFNGGDHITILETNEDGWWRGECNGREGWFPASYVDPVPMSEGELQAAPAAANTLMRRNSSHGINPETTVAAAEWVRAMHDYAPQNGDELGFKEGDVFSITQKDGEWWEGTLNGVTGWFPANYVEVMAPDEHEPHDQGFTAAGPADSDAAGQGEGEGQDQDQAANPFGPVPVDEDSAAKQAKPRVYSVHPLLLALPCPALP
jgi:hypothetical protein